MLVDSYIMGVIVDRLFYEGAITSHATSTPNVFRLTVASSPDTESLYLMQAQWYEYSDECGQFSQGFFLTEEDAKLALDHYCKEYLDV